MSIQSHSQEPFDIFSYLRNECANCMDEHQKERVLEKLDTRIQKVSQLRLGEGQVVSVTPEKIHGAVKEWLNGSAHRIPSAYGQWEPEVQQALIKEVVAELSPTVSANATPGEFMRALGIDTSDHPVMQCKVVICDEDGSLRFSEVSHATEETKLLSEDPTMRKKVVRSVLNLALKAAESGESKKALQIFKDLIECPWVSRTLRGDEDASGLISKIAGKLDLEQCDASTLKFFEDLHSRLGKPDLKFTYYDPIRRAVIAALNHYDKSVITATHIKNKAVAELLPDTGPKTVLRYVEAILTLPEEEQKLIQLIKEDGSGRVVVYKEPLIKSGKDLEVSAVMHLMDAVDQAFKEGDEDTAIRLLSALSRLKNVSLRNEKVLAKYKELTERGVALINNKFEDLLKHADIQLVVDFLVEVAGSQWVLTALKLPGKENTKFIRLQKQLTSRLEGVLKGNQTVAEVLSNVNKMIDPLEGVPGIKTLIPQFLDKLIELQGILEQHQENESRLCELLIAGNTLPKDIQDWRRSRSMSVSSSSTDSSASRELRNSLGVDGELVKPLCKEVKAFFLKANRHIVHFRAYPEGSTQKEVWDKIRKVEIQGHKVVIASGKALLLKFPDIDHLELIDLQNLYKAVVMLEELLRVNEDGSQAHEEAKKLVGLLYHLQEYQDVSLLAEIPKAALFSQGTPFLKDTDRANAKCFDVLCGTGSSREMGRDEVIRSLLWAAATGKNIPETVWPKIIVLHLKMGGEWDKIAKNLALEFSDPVDQARLVILASHLGEKYRMTKVAQTASESKIPYDVDRLFQKALDPKSKEEELDEAVSVLQDFALYNLSEIPSEEWHNPDNFNSPELAPNLCRVLQMNQALQYSLQTSLFTGINFQDSKSLELIGRRAYKLMQMIDKALLRGDYCTAHVLYNVYNGVPMQRIIFPKGEMELGVFRYLSVAEREECQKMHDQFGQRLDPHQGRRDCTSQTGELALAAGLRLTTYPENMMRFITGPVAKRGKRTAHGQKYVEESVLADFSSIRDAAVKLKNKDSLRAMSSSYCSKLPDKKAKGQMDKVFDLTADTVRGSLGVS